MKLTVAVMVIPSATASSKTSKPAAVTGILTAMLRPTVIGVPFQASILLALTAKDLEQDTLLTLSVLS